MEPYEELDQEYEADEDLSPEQNKAFKTAHRKYRYLLSLYYKLVGEISAMKEENRKLKEEYDKRFNTIEETQRLQTRDISQTLEIVKKIDDKMDKDADWFRKAVLGGMITLTVGLIAGVITFAINN